MARGTLDHWRTLSSESCFYDATLRISANRFRERSFDRPLNWRETFQGKMLRMHLSCHIAQKFCGMPIRNILRKLDKQSMLPKKVIRLLTNLPFFHDPPEILILVNVDSW